MNIQEAMRTGGKFKRKSWDRDMWCHIAENKDGCKEVLFVEDDKPFQALEGDILADDWETKPKLMELWMKCGEQKVNAGPRPRGDGWILFHEVEDDDG